MVMVRKSNRESAAIYVTQHLMEEGAKLSIYDPKVTREQILSDLEHPFISGDDPDRVARLVSVESDPYVAAEGSHALVVCTEWDEFRDVGNNQTTLWSFLSAGQRKHVSSDFGFDKFRYEQ